MKIPIDGIQAFVQIAELGSFIRAAEALNVTQTALTRRIQRVEAFLDLKLLDRTTRSVTLTPVGREFLPTAKRLVTDLVDGVERLRTTAQFAIGDVTLATLQSVAFRQLPKVLDIYARRFPANRVQLIERSGALVTEAVATGQADFGVHIVDESQLGLQEDPLVRDPFVLLCHRDHPIASRDALRWRDLGSLDIITLGGVSGNRRLVEEQLLIAGLPARGRIVVETTPTAMALAAAGTGVAILPAAVRDSWVANLLVEVPLIEPIIYRSIALVRRRGVTLTPAAAALYDICRTEMRGTRAYHRAPALDAPADDPR